MKKYKSNSKKSTSKKKSSTKRYSHLDSLIGMIKVKGAKETNLSERKDDFYYKD